MATDVDHVATDEYCYRSEVRYDVNPPQVALTLFNLGLAHRKSGDKSAARAALERARGIFEAEGRPEDVADCDVQLQLLRCPCLCYCV